MKQKATLFDMADENTAEVSRPNKRRQSKPLARARRSDPPSSHSAASRFEKSTKLSIHRETVIDQVYTHPGLTSKQITDFCEGMDRHEVARRLPEAEKAGEIHSRGRDQPGQITWWPGEATDN